MKFQQVPDEFRARTGLLFFDHNAFFLGPAGFVGLGTFFPIDLQLEVIFLALAQLFDDLGGRAIGDLDGLRVLHGAVVGVADDVAGGSFVGLPLQGDFLLFDVLRGSKFRAAQEGDLLRTGKLPTRSSTEPATLYW